MAYLAAATALVALLCLLNLVLTLGVVKRLRAHADLLSSGGDGPVRTPTLPPGEIVDDFTAAAENGGVLSRADLAPGTLVAFFALDCAPCRVKLPGFVARARTLTGPVLAVVVAEEGEETAPTVERLSAVADVVVEPPEGPVGSAFGVVGFPAFCVMDEGQRIAASRTDLDGLPVPATT